MGGLRAIARVSRICEYDRTSDRPSAHSIVFGSGGDNDSRSQAFAKILRGSDQWRAGSFEPSCDGSGSAVPGGPTAACSCRAAGASGGAARPRPIGEIARTYRALSRRFGGPNPHRLDLSAGGGPSRALGQRTSQCSGGRIAGCNAAAAMGREREGFDGRSASSGDDERQARLDAAAKRSSLNRTTCRTPFSNYAPRLRQTAI